MTAQFNDFKKNYCLLITVLELTVLIIKKNNILCLVLSIYCLAPLKGRLDATFRYFLAATGRCWNFQMRLVDIIAI